MTAGAFRAGTGGTSKTSDTAGVPGRGHNQSVRDPDGTDWGEWVDRACTRIVDAGQWRATRDFDAAGPEGLLARVPGQVADTPVVSFASNDYLGLSQHPAAIAAATAAIASWGTGSGAARLVVGSRSLHRELERELAEWRRQDAAVLFPTGYAANLGVLTTFAGPGTRILSDELNHASIVDGCRLSRGDAQVYAHGRVDQLATMLQADRRPTVVVTDTVFSMDGDVAPLDEMVELCVRHRALLVLDEAHAVLGPDPTVDDVDGLAVLRVGTLSKTLGSLGGFVAGSRPMVDLLVNRARSFIFTTASTPADTAAALANLRVLRSAEGKRLVERLRTHVDRIAPGHPSPILPIVIGEERAAVAASSALLDRGLLVPAIRPPTVPKGTSRLRIALSAAHTDQQIDALAGALRDLSLVP